MLSQRVDSVFTVIRIKLNWLSLHPLQYLLGPWNGLHYGTIRVVCGSTSWLHQTYLFILENEFSTSKLFTHCPLHASFSSQPGAWPVERCCLFCYNTTHLLWPHDTLKQVENSAFDFVFSEFKLKQQGLPELALHAPGKENPPPYRQWCLWACSPAECWQVCTFTPFI